jgi:hypothetical protein
MDGRNKKSLEERERMGEEKDLLSRERGAHITQQDLIIILVISSIFIFSYLVAFSGSPALRYISAAFFQSFVSSAHSACLLTKSRVSTSFEAPPAAKTFASSHCLRST